MQPLQGMKRTDHPTDNPSPKKQKSDGLSLSERIAQRKEAKNAMDNGTATQEQIDLWRAFHGEPKIPQRTRSAPQQPTYQAPMYQAPVAVPVHVEFMDTSDSSNSDDTQQPKPTLQQLRPTLQQLSNGYQEQRKNYVSDSVVQFVKAAKDNNFDRVLHYTIKEGINVNAEEPLEGMTALRGAVRGGHVDMARYLIFRGANLNVDRNEVPSLMRDAAATGNTNMVKMLIENGAPMCYTALIDSILADDFAMTTCIIQENRVYNAQHNRTDFLINQYPRTHGDLPILVAIDNEKFEMAQILATEPSIDLNLVGRNGYTALGAAIEQKNVELVAFLKKRGAYKV